MADTTIIFGGAVKVETSPEEKKVNQLYRELHAARLKVAMLSREYRDAVKECKKSEGEHNE